MSQERKPSKQGKPVSSPNRYEDHFPSANFCTQTPRRRTLTARLLPRLLDGRRTGPVFLTDRRARVELPPADIDPGSSRARLSYRRAAELFEVATTDLPRGPWTLHQLRHSALTHAADCRQPLR